LGGSIPATLAEGWTGIEDFIGAGAQPHGLAVWKVLDADDLTTPQVFVLSGAGTALRAWQATPWTGVDPNDPIDAESAVTFGTVSPGGSVAAPAVTTTTPGAVVVSFLATSGPLSFGVDADAVGDGWDPWW